MTRRQIQKQLFLSTLKIFVFWLLTDVVLFFLSLVMGLILADTDWPPGFSPENSGLSRVIFALELTLVCSLITKPIFVIWQARRYRLWSRQIENRWRLIWLYPNLLKLD